MLQDKDPTIVQKTPNNQMTLFKQAVGDSGKKKNALLRGRNLQENQDCIIAV